MANTSEEVHCQVKSSPSFHFRVRVCVFEKTSFWRTATTELQKEQCGREQCSFSHLYFVFFLISFQFHALDVLGVLSLILLLLGRDIAKQKILSFDSYHKLETIGIIGIAQINK